MIVSGIMYFRLQGEGLLYRVSTILVGDSSAPRYHLNGIYKEEKGLR